MGIKEEKRSGEERKNEREWRRERGRAGAGGGGERKKSQKVQDRASEEDLERKSKWIAKGRRQKGRNRRGI